MNSYTTEFYEIVISFNKPESGRVIGITYPPLKEAKIEEYSYLPDKRAGPNKRVGWKNVGKAG